MTRKGDEVMWLVAHAARSPAPWRPQAMNQAVIQVKFMMSNLSYLPIVPEVDQPDD